MPLNSGVMHQGLPMRAPVVQEETSGCGIASVANILGKTYSEMKIFEQSCAYATEDNIPKKSNAFFITY